MKGQTMRLRTHLGLALTLSATVWLSTLNQNALASTSQGKGGEIKTTTSAPTSKKTVPKKTSARRTRSAKRKPTTGSETSAQPGNNTTPGKASANERTYWETIRNSTDPEDFRAYLKKYPNGEFADLAKNRLNALEAAKAKSESKAAELTFWDSIKNSSNVGDFKAYLEKYPDGEFVSLAKNRIGSLEAAEREKEKKASAKREAETLASQAQSLSDQGRFTEAEAKAREAARLDPSNKDAPYQLGRALLDQKRFSEAEAAFRETIRLSPSNAPPHNALGEALREQKKYSEAEAAHRRAISLAPHHAQYHFNLGSDFYVQQRYSEAEAKYREAVRLFPNNSTFSEWLQKALRMQGKR